MIADANGACDRVCRALGPYWLYRDIRIALLHALRNVSQDDTTPVPRPGPSTCTSFTCLAPQCSVLVGLDDWVDGIKHVSLAVSLSAGVRRWPDDDALWGNWLVVLFYHYILSIAYALSLSRALSHSLVEIFS